MTKVLKGVAKRVLGYKDNGAKAVEFIQNGFNKSEDTQLYFYDGYGNRHTLQKTLRQKITDKSKNIYTAVLLLWVFFAGTFWGVYSLCMLVNFIVDKLF